MALYLCYSVLKNTGWPRITQMPRMNTIKYKWIACGKKINTLRHRLTQMKTIFETERLIVRQFTEKDKDNFFLLSGNETVMQYIRPVSTKEESDKFLLENKKDNIK